MRSVLHSDVVAVARALLLVPASLRIETVWQLFREAEFADGYRGRNGRAHPVWGDGCLETAAARRNQAPEPFFENPDYCACMITIFEELLNWRKFSRGRR